MTLIVALRPEPGLAATIAAGAQLGLEIAAAPLSEIRPLAWEPPDDPVDGLLVGSANAFRHGGDNLANLAGMPVYAVGESTAAAARAAGFAVTQAGSGGLQDLLETLAGQSLTLLRLTGEERVPIAPPAGIEVITRIAYHAAPLPLPEATAGRLRAGGLVLLHAGSAAQRLASECERLAIARGGIALACLSERIAQQAGRGWAAVQVAERPSDPALLALARDMCH